MPRPSKPVKKKSGGAHALRAELMTLNHHLEQCLVVLSRARKFGDEVGATDQLALAVKALRTIANAPDGARVEALRGVARGALAKMGIGE